MMKNMILILMLCAGSFLPVYAAEQAALQNQKEIHLDVNDLSTFRETEAYQKLIGLYSFYSSIDDLSEDNLQNLSSITDIIEGWRKKYNLDKQEVSKLFFNILQEYVGAKKSRKKSVFPEDMFDLSLYGIQYYPAEEGKMKALLKELLAFSPDDADDVMDRYQCLYPNSIIVDADDDECIEQAILSAQIESSARKELCKAVIKRYAIEADQAKKQKLLDKAYKWAFIDANIVYFYMLDRFLLDHKENYADLPARKVQLEKEFAFIKQKKMPQDSWIYRRLKAAIENFGKGPEAQKIVRDIDNEE